MILRTFQTKERHTSGTHTIKSLFKNPTPNLMAFTWVTNAHGPSPQPTAFRSPTSYLLGLTTATGSNQARFESPSPEKSGVETIRCQHIFYLLFWPKSWNGLINWAHFLSFLAFWAWINCSVWSLFDRKTFCCHWGSNPGYSLYSGCLYHSAI